MTMEKLVSQRILIRIRNISAAHHGPFAADTPKHLDLEGVVMLRPHWEQDRDVFGFAIPFDPVLPLRQIHISLVEAINGIPMVHAKPKAAQQTWKVANSKGNGHYTVTLFDGFWSCECVANSSFRKVCRHIKEQQEKLNVN